MRKNIRTLLCETDRLAEVMKLPVGEFMEYAERAKEVEPRKALERLAEMYMEYCGISAGQRSVIYYAADYWKDELRMEEAFCYIMPEISEKYRENREKYDEYDTIVLTCQATRDIAFGLLEDIDDEEGKIALCAGVMYDLRNNSWPSERKIQNRGIKKIEEFIINMEEPELMRLRRENLWHKRQGFSEAEVEHLRLLNDRLMELQEQVLGQVGRITARLCGEVAEGNRDYEDFNVEGYIYIEYDDNKADDRLLNVLLDAVPQYNIIITGSTPKDIDEICNIIRQNKVWWKFRELAEVYNIPVCRAFDELFDRDSPLAVEDIMKITPEQLQSGVRILI